jgi:hypothetical protein
MLKTPANGRPSEEFEFGKNRMAIRNSLQEEIVVSGDRVEWLDKCVNALTSSGFTKINKNAHLSQIEAAYRTWKVWGTILVTLIPVGSDTKITMVSTANVDNLWALFQSPTKSILTAFKNTLR